MNDSGIVSQSPTLARLLTEAPGDTAARNPGALLNRSRGVLLGLAAGNLLGLPVESEWHYDIARRYPSGLADMDPREAHRPMDDDLAQAVDLAEALLADGDTAAEFARLLIVWARENGRGMGVTTGEVIRELQRGEPIPEPARIVYERRNRIAPNGGVMRCAPVAIARRSLAGTGNCSDLRGSEELLAGGEGVQALGAPGAEDRRQCHFGFGSPL